MPKIFISYRRDDSLHATGRIYDRLATAFGESNVFKDVDSMPLGIDFRKALNDQVAQCDVVLAVIGDDWLSAADPAGSRRLDDEADYVRIEIEAALKRDIPVVPLLIGNAPLPKAKDLPETMSQLAYRNGTALREDPHFRSDVERVVKALSHIGPPVRSPSPEGSGIGSTGGAPQVEIVSAESVGPPTPHVSGGWQVNALLASPPPKASPGKIDWFTLGRCSLVAAASPVPFAIGVEYDCMALAGLIYIALAPAALVFAFYPWIYQKIWMQIRGGTDEDYQRQRQSEGQLPYWIIYIAFVAALLLFGALMIDSLWVSVLPIETPLDSSWDSSSDTQGETTSPSSYAPSEDATIGYQSIADAIDGDTPEPAPFETSTDSPFSGDGSPFAKE
jgi:hypothetical protein